MKGQTVVSTEALDELMAAIPPYIGLAIYISGEEPEFNAAESRLSRAYQNLRESMEVGS